jgi:hypothetical protein
MAKELQRKKVGRMTDRYKEAVQGARDCVERNKDGGVYIPDLLRVIDSQQAEIEQWKEEANRYQTLWCEDVQFARAEAIKEFAERLKAESVYLGIDSDCFICTDVGEWKTWETVGEWCEETIDNLVKEMVGEQE